MIKKSFKILGIVILSIFSLLLILLTVIPYVFKSQITDAVEQVANDNLEAKIEFSELGLSVFKHFPALIVYAKDINITNPKFKEASNVVSANTAAVGINLFQLFKGKIVLDAIYLDQANLNLEIDSLGSTNFNIVKPSETPTDTTTTQFKIKKIIVNNTDIKYNDKSTPLSFKVVNLNYKGEGDLSADLFDLKSSIKMNSFDLSAGNIDYVRNKPINAEIITNVDAKELKFKFEKNDIRIKNFPFSFNGYFSFVKGGYEFDLEMKSKNSTLEEMLSLVPPSYETWKEQMDIAGNIKFILKTYGCYMQDQSEKPIFSAKLKVDSGSLAYKKIKEPIKNINIDAKAIVTNLDLNNLKLDVENFSFNLAGDQTKIHFHSLGYKTIDIESDIKTTLDLAKLKDALHLDKHEVRGKLNLDLNAKGTFMRGLGFSPRLNKVDTIIKSIPRFTLLGSLKNGYLKNKAKKDPIKNITMDLQLFAKDSILRNVTGKISNINIEALENYIRGDFELHSLFPFHIDTELESKFNLAEINKFYPLDSLEIRGDLNLKVSAHGVLNSKAKKYPTSNTSVVIKNGFLKSLKFPTMPLENINLATKITSFKGTAEDLAISIDPLQFDMAGSPFKITGKVNNLRDINYDINIKGLLDIGKLTKIFPVKDMDIVGTIQSNLFAKGSKKDLDAKNWANIENKGKLVASKIKINSKLFPENFLIESGTFLFKRDKMRFQEFLLNYGKSDMVLTGSVENFLRFWFNRKVLREKKEKLNATIDLKSNHLNANEFLTMIAKYTEQKAEDEQLQTADTLKQLTKAAGVKEEAKVLRIPGTANLKVTAHVKEIEFDTYKMNNFNGELLVKDRKIDFSNATFEMAGTKIAMSGVYKAEHRYLAKYDAKFKAQNFDIQRAYKEIPIFAQMVSMAKDAYGLVSVDYKLAGSINKNMEIDFKAIEGEGTLTLEDIKFKNFKLLEHVAKKADANDLDKASFNKIDIHSTIKNNVMTITPVTMKMAGFRGKLEGQVTMDGKLNIGFRLGLPPMGLINVPMKITGTADNFEISTGKYKQDNTFAEESELKNLVAPQPRRKTQTDTLNPQNPQNNKVLDSINNTK